MSGLAVVRWTLGRKLLAFALAVDWNRMIVAERAHTSRVPRLIVSGMPAEPVQDRRNHLIRLVCRDYFIGIFYFQSTNLYFPECSER